jgi:serine/threonine protein kinase
MPTRAASRGGLGRYRHLLDLGRGGMADVWLAATRGSAGIDVLHVVKELKEELSEEDEFRRMFLDEARLAARLNHPNVVRTHEVGESDGEYFLVMEYLDGQSLHAIRKLRDFPLRAELRVLGEVLEGLHYAHELAGLDGRGLAVVHRDISPQNVFVTYTGHVKVVDFGIAKALTQSSSTRAGEIKGKASYMSPEQVRAVGAVDRRTDLFAMGVLLWEAIANRPMWQGVPELAVLHRLSNGQIPSLRDRVPEAPPALLELVESALSPEPARRPPTAAAMQRQLEAAVREMGGPLPRADLASWMERRFQADRLRTRQILESQLRQSDAPPPGKRKFPTVPPPSTQHTLVRPTASGPPAKGIVASVAGPYRALTELQKHSETGFLELEHTVTGEPLLLKLKDTSQDPTFLARAPSVAALRHPNTVRLVDFGSLFGGRFFFSIHERLEGITLAGLLESRGHLPTPRALTIVRQLLSSLSEAHDHGQVHGRLHPAQLILVDHTDDHVKVLGYGGAFEAPQTVEADLAAVAAILYQMLFGVSPDFEGPRTEGGLPRVNHPLFAEDRLVSYLERLFGLQRPFDSAHEALRALAPVEVALLEGMGAASVAPVLSGAGTTSLTGVLRTRLHRLMSLRKPAVWVLDGDPAVEEPAVELALEEIGQSCAVTLLDADERTRACEGLLRGSVDPPWVLVFGDLHVILAEPVLEALKAVGEVSRLLVSTHANAELLASTVNDFGLDQQVCLPASAKEVVEAIEAMVDRTRRLHHHYDDVRLALRDVRQQLNPDAP